MAVCELIMKDWISSMQEVFTAYTSVSGGALRCPLSPRDDPFQVLLSGCHSVWTTWWSYHPAPIAGIYKLCEKNGAVSEQSVFHCNSGDCTVLCYKRSLSGQCDVPPSPPAACVCSVWSSDSGANQHSAEGRQEVANTWVNCIGLWPIPAKLMTFPSASAVPCVWC